MVATLVTLIIVAGAYFGATLRGSVLQQALFTVRNSSATNYQQLTNKFANNSFISNLPLLLFWIGVGFVVYYFAVSVYGALQETVELEQEMGYANTNRNVLVREAVMRLGIRLIGVTLWFLYVGWFVKDLIPYVLASVHKLTGAAASGHDVEMLIWATALLLIGMQVHAIFLRWITLKHRVFSSGFFE